jgi:hypothetical protein
VRRGESYDEHENNCEAAAEKMAEYSIRFLLL